MKKLRLIQTLILCLSFQICVGFGMVEHSCTVNDANKPTHQNSNKSISQYFSVFLMQAIEFFNIKVTFPNPCKQPYSSFYPHLDI